MPQQLTEDGMRRQENFRRFVGDFPPRLSGIDEGSAEYNSILNGLRQQAREYGVQDSALNTDYRSLHGIVRNQIMEL
jgi:hypothetical protein